MVEQTRRLGCAALLLGASLLPAAAQEPWTLSVMLPLTGPASGYSQEIRLGFEIAQEEINKSGGVDGRPLSLTMLDTQTNSGQIATLIRQACADSFMVFSTLSNEARVSFPVANSLRCPALGTGTSAVGLTASNRPWAFAVLTPSDVLTPPAVERIVRKYKPKKAVVFVEKADVAAQDYANLAIATLKKDGVEYETIATSGGDVDFGPPVTRAAAAEPDLMVVASFDRAASGLLKEIRKSGLKRAVLLMPSAFNAVVGALPSDVLAGVIRFHQSDPYVTDEPRASTFTKTFESRADGRKATITATLAYDALFLARDTLKAAHPKGDEASRSDDRKKFADTLAVTKDWKGLVGTVSMSPKGYMEKLPDVFVYNGKDWEKLKD